MRLVECLNSSDISTLQMIASSHRLECHRSSKNALLQEIISHFNDKEFVDGQLVALSPLCKGMVSQLILDRRTSYSREELEAIAKRTAGPGENESADQAIDALLRGGWIFRLGAQSGKELFYVPEDIRTRVRGSLSKILQNQVRKAETEPIAYRDDHLALVRDTGLFLAYVKRHDVKLTVEGTIFKRQLLQLLDSMEIKEPPLRNVGWRFGYGRRFHDYPNRFALLYDYCFASGLIEETADNRLVLTSKAEEWMGEQEKKRLADLLQFWKKTYRRPIPKLPLALATLVQTVHTEWVYVDSVVALLDSCVQEYYYDTKENIIRERILGMLVHLGMAHHGQTAEGGQVIRLSELGKEMLLDETVQAEEPEQPVPLVVQPNFEVLLPRDESGRLSWDLERMADLVKADRIRVYRLTRESVQRCLADGWTTEQILEFLQANTGNVLPSNVERTICRWGDEFGRVEVKPVLLVSCRDEGVFEEIIGLELVRDAIVAALPPRCFAVRETEAAHVVALLEKMGYAPTMRRG